MNGPAESGEKGRPSKDGDGPLPVPAGSGEGANKEERAGSKQFLRHVRIWERLPARISGSHLRVASVAGGVLLLCAAVFAALPTAEAVRDGGFTLVGTEVLADLVAGLRASAAPLAVLAVLALAADAYLAYRPRQPDGWHVAVAAQPYLALGAFGGLAGALTIVAINLLLWLLIGLALLALLCLGLWILGAMAAG